MTKLHIKLFMVFSFLQVGCTPQKEPVYQPKEGEIVTWKQNDYLIVKAKLGERRKHIVAAGCPKCERDFYRPEHEHYLGQFPIDYRPEKFPKISVAEAMSLPMPHVGGELEFNLMLNGSTVQATDQSPYGLRTDSFDDMNQVKVFITNFGIIDRESNINSKQFFESNYINKSDTKRKRRLKEDNLDCYSSKEFRGWKNCFGISKSEMISGFYYSVSPEKDSVILGRSNEFIYGGVNITWFTNKKNINQAKEIDAAIWRLLDAWNVSPIQNSKKINGK